ncbi:MAG: aldehyde dehydrogenase family protein [Caulobacteraceae bacterium]|nr:aldehyde dehydrogenase family protein [Caulobacteraceae bacterium]
MVEAVLDQQAWRSRADAVAWDVRPFVDGALRESHAAERFAVRDPATGAVLHEVAAGDARDVAAAVASARAAFDDGRWSGLGVLTRKALLEAFIDAVVAQAEELALLDSLEIGKPISAALFDAQVLSPMFGRFCVESVDRLFGVVANTEPEVLAFSVAEPRGVVGAITPWNFPLVNAIIKVAPALAAGNTIVLKPSELAAASAVRLARIAVEAGLPPGVLNVVPGLGRTVGQALASHDDVDMLSFTGSTATGRLLMRSAGASNGKPLLLECGGKSPAVVFADADDLGAVARHICAEALHNQGQVCVSRSRVIVQDSIKGALLEALVEAARAYQPGDPLDPATGFGPLASREQWLRARDLILAGASQGHGPVLGDLTALSSHGGADMAPFVFSDLGRDNPLWREEVFGPVIVLESFSTPVQALALANDTAYGLAATVWTRDLSLGQAMARGIRAGEVTVRATAAEYEGPGFVLPQEGRKGSGFGSETGVEGLRSYTTWKKVEFHTARLA